MCQRVTCRSCGKPTFAGCGRHVEQVLGDVPLPERCHCRDGQSKAQPKREPSPAGWLTGVKDWLR